MNWFMPAGSSTDPQFETVVRPDGDDWRHTGLLVAHLAPRESRVIATGGDEYLVVPLEGRGVRVAVCDESGSDTAQFELAGRSDVFAGPTDVAYVPRGHTMTVTAGTEGRVLVALPFAAARTERPPRRIAADEVPVELRGAGSCSRQVHNFGVPAVLDADSIIACEVLTPGGNWSSYPPHKHDEDLPGVQSELEEIYYFRLRADPHAPAGAVPMGYQRVYGTQERPIEVLEEVRTGDVVLVPHGWHGPSTVPPGYDMYYLNVMAGPGAERAWLICDDPEHGWVRDTWAAQSIDPRLPFGQRGPDAQGNP